MWAHEFLFSFSFFFFFNARHQVLQEPRCVLNMSVVMRAQISIGHNYSLHVKRVLTLSNKFEKIPALSTIRSGRLRVQSKSQKKNRDSSAHRGRTDTTSPHAVCAQTRLSERDWNNNLKYEGMRRRFVSSCRQRGGEWKVNVCLLWLFLFSTAVSGEAPVSSNLINLHQKNVSV